MKVLGSEDGELVITENYVGVLMQASDQLIGVCERDGGFEIGVYQPDGSRIWYSILDGKITPQAWEYREDCAKDLEVAENALVAAGIMGKKEA